jgi:hypothetical protein
MECCKVAWLGRVVAVRHPPPCELVWLIGEAELVEQPLDLQVLPRLIYIYIYIYIYTTYKRANIFFSKTTHQMYTVKTPPPDQTQ